MFSKPKINIQKSAVHIYSNPLKLLKLCCFSRVKLTGKAGKAIQIHESEAAVGIED